jgi:nucleotide-binding universal stress UspA family protein
MRVLIATDFSAHAEDALALVAGLVIPAGSAIRLVHVVEPLPAINALAPSEMLTLAAEGEREIMTELDRKAAMFGDRALVVQTALVIGRPADVIVEEAQRFHADLVVLGSRGRRRVAATLLGSVSAEVVDRAPCPVLVARGRALTRVVLADDGSEVAAAGADLVTNLPALRSLPVQVVSVVDAPFPFTMANSDAGPSMYAAIQAYYDSLPSLREATSRIASDRSARLNTAGLRTTAEMREGDAADELIAAAAAGHADGIVIGSHGRTGVSRLFLGSVARAVLFNAPCSVLIVRAPVAVRNGAPRESVAVAR